MLITSLAYIFNNDRILMLKCLKQNDNYNKYLGLGGKLKKDESIDECMLREVKEESNLLATDYQKVGIINFYNTNYHEQMHLYRIDKYDGTLKGNSEGILEWININDIFSLNLWEGDKVFLPRLINKETDINLDLYYSNDLLIDYKERI